MSLRLDDINMRENAIRLSLQTIDSCLLKLDEQTTRNTRALAQLRHAAGIQGSPPPWENPASVETGSQKLLEKGISPHRVNTPPQRVFNEDRLRPFTDYHGGGRQRPPLQHGMSVDRSEFEQRFSGMIGVGGARHGHLSQSDEAVQPSKKVTLASADPGNPEHQHYHSDLPDGAVPPRLGRSLSTGRSESPRTLSLRGSAPTASLHPIVTPTRLEYSSITDCIDTSCFERPVVYSPPNTPEMRTRTRRDSASGPAHRKKTGGHHHHPHRHRHRRKTEASLNEGLRTAEENEHRQMEVSHVVTWSRGRWSRGHWSRGHSHRRQKHPKSGRAKLPSHPLPTFFPFPSSPFHLFYPIPPFPFPLTPFPIPFP